MIIISVLILVMVIGVLVMGGLLFKKKETKTNEESGYKSNTNENIIKDQKIGDFSMDFHSFHLHYLLEFLFSE
mgnify:CR=1 FL=1